MGIAEDIYGRLSSEADVEVILEDPETLHLDFKQWNADNYPDKVAVALSGFANADGGVLVFGVTDKRRLHPFSDPSSIAQRIQERLKNLVQRPVPNADAKAIPSQTDRSKGYVAVLVPASDEAPHRCAKDHEYYRRHGESFLKMEHYEIADIFGRRHHPTLRLQLRLRSERQTDPTGPYYQVYAGIAIANVGRTIARFPAITQLEVTNGFERPHGGTFEHSGLPEWRQPDGQRAGFRGGADHVVHAGSALEVTRVRRDFRSPEPSDGAFRVRARIQADGFPPAEKTVAVSNQVVAEAIAGKTPVLDD